MKTATDEFSVQAYQIGERIDVVADLPGVCVDELTVGFTNDPTALIIEVEKHLSGAGFFSLGSPSTIRKRTSTTVSSISRFIDQE